MALAPDANSLTATVAAPASASSRASSPAQKLANLSQDIDSNSGTSTSQHQALDTPSGTQGSTSSFTQSIATKATPPIFLKSTGHWVSTMTLIKEAGIVLKQCKTQSDSIKLVTSSVDDYRKLVKVLEFNKLEFYTFNLPAEKPLVVVIRGLPINISSQEIKDELVLQGYPVLSCAWMKGGVALAIVTLERTDLGRSIYDLTNFFNLGVQVEGKKHTKGPIQCTNCQDFGHTKGSCFQKAVCVKCVLTHPPGECPKKYGEVQCRNCLGNHPTTFKGCEYYILAAQKLEKAAKAKTLKKNSPTTPAQLKPDSLVTRLPPKRDPAFSLPHSQEPRANNSVNLPVSRLDKKSKNKPSYSEALSQKTPSETSTLQPTDSLPISRLSLVLGKTKKSLWVPEPSSQVSKKKNKNSLASKSSKTSSTTLTNVGASNTHSNKKLEKSSSGTAQRSNLSNSTFTKEAVSTFCESIAKSIAITMMESLSKLFGNQ